MAFISEIHYRNSVATSVNIPEFVEIAISAKEYTRLENDPTGPSIQLVMYNETSTNNSKLTTSNTPGVDTFKLTDPDIWSTATVEPNSGFYIFTVVVLTGAPTSTTEFEAFALIDQNAAVPVQQFYQLGTERIYTAIDGPAAGLQATNLTLTSSQSMQFDKAGNRLDGTISVNTAVVCFVRGTQIETSLGPRSIESLQINDFVQTHDTGLLPIRWIGSRALHIDELRESPNLYPIRIHKNALAPNIPNTDLMVSPQHRVFVQSKIAERIFGRTEILVPAKALLPLDGVEIASEVTNVEYFHILFDDHQLVMANNTLAETLLPATQAMKSLGPSARQEIYSLFPELRYSETIPKTIRQITTVSEARELVERHRKNNKEFVINGWNFG